MALDLAALPPWPEDDHAQYGPVRETKLSRIQILAGGYLHRNWLSIPHVFHHDEVDVTDAEAARKDWNERQPEARLTPLVPLLVAVARAIDRYPRFATSLGSDGQTLVFKDYRHLGVAVDTPAGLLVGVLRDVDRKPLPQLAHELAELTAKARERGLSWIEMSGAVMTVSSLGHIGGTGFTPIINAPQVAILGVTKLQTRPVFGENGALEPRTFLPLSLSYDHRVLNGVDAARFTQAVGEELTMLGTEITRSDPVDA